MIMPVISRGSSYLRPRLTVYSLRPQTDLPRGDENVRNFPSGMFLSLIDD